MRVNKKSNIILSFIILFTIIYGAVNISKTISLKNQKLEIISQNKNLIKQLTLENKTLQDELRNSESTEFIEKVAREDLGMLKPREVIYIDKNKEDLQRGRN